MNSHVTSLKTRPGHTPMFCIDNREIPILQEKKSYGRTVVNVSNITPDVVDFARSAAEIYIKPRSKGFIQLF